MKSDKKQKDYLTPKEIASTLKITYASVLELLQYGFIKAEKVSGKWNIKPSQLEAFKKNNEKAIEKLKVEYVALYWQGLTPTQLEWHVPEDFRQRHIVATKKGFATMAICDSLPKRKRDAQ